jgi:hypothetical protein
MNPNNPNYNPANSKSPDVTPVLPNPALNPNANYNLQSGKQSESFGLHR